jgi:transcriptional regulator with XRE-family HTH domain
MTKFVTEQLKLSSSKVTAWKSGAIPKYEILQQIADFFGVTIGYLFDGEYTSPPKENEYSPAVVECMTKFQNLTDVDKGRILNEMDIFLRGYVMNGLKSNASSETAAEFVGGLDAKQKKYA